MLSCSDGESKPRDTASDAAPHSVSADQLASTQDPYIIGDPSQLEIGLERTRCFGGCPAYRITIDGHGNVSYHGLANVVHSCEESWSIPSEVLTKLLDEFRSVRFCELDESYTMAVSDLSQTILWLRSGDELCRVTNYWIGSRSRVHDPSVNVAMHEALDRLAMSIDSAVNSLRFVGNRK